MKRHVTVRILGRLQQLLLQPPPRTLWPRLQRLKRRRRLKRCQSLLKRPERPQAGEAPVPVVDPEAPGRVSNIFKRCSCK